MTPVYGAKRFIDISTEIKSCLEDLVSYRTMDSWENLRDEFSRKIATHDLTPEKVSRWNPYHPELQKLKEVWMRIAQTIETNRPKSLNSVIADVARAQLICAQYDYLRSLPDPQADCIPAIQRSLSQNSGSSDPWDAQRLLENL